MKTTILDYVNNIINDVNKTHFYEFDKSTANNIFRPGYQFYTWMQFCFLVRLFGQLPILDNKITITSTRSHPVLCIECCHEVCVVYLRSNSKSLWQYLIVMATQHKPRCLFWAVYSSDYKRKGVVKKVCLMFLIQWEQIILI